MQGCFCSDQSMGLQIQKERPQRQHDACSGSKKAHSTLHQPWQNHCLSKFPLPPQAPSKDTAKTKTKEKHVDALFSTQAEFHVLPQTVIYFTENTISFFEIRENLDNYFYLPNT